MTLLRLVKSECREGPHSAPKTPDHRILGLLRLVTCASLLCCELSAHVEAYVFLTSPPTVWPNGKIPMDLQLGSVAGGAALIDGNTSWNTVAENALATWNLYINTVKFTVYTQSPKPRANGDGTNQVFFDSTVYGQSFGAGVLAITTTWSIGTTRTEGDTVFNSTLSWNSYRGNLLPAASGGTLLDFQRVALHEFGHTLGLGHPDLARQNVLALMNSTISDLDHLTTDDTSGAFVLYGGLPPSIVTPPQTQTVIVGSTVTFSVAASGSQPLSYQWKCNGVNISGATSANYTIFNVQTSQAGNYTVVMSNAGGTATSATAVLTVNVLPSITAQPQNRTVTAGKSVTFSVTASGTTPLSYQWYHDNSAVAGATAASYTISGVQPTDAGDYKATVSNVAGELDSASATLTVQYVPVITGQPQSQNAKIGETVTFSVAAAAIPAPTYQWKFNSVNIPGAISSSYTLISFQPTNVGNYTVVVRNSLGSITSSNAVLGVAVCVPAPPGLVGWWPGAGDVADVVGGNSGTLQGAIGFAPGKVGQAFSFDGINDVVEVPDSATIGAGVNSAMTVELWAYRTTSNAVAHILGKRVGCGVDPRETDYQMAWDVANGLSFSSSAGAGVGTGIQLPLRIWTHLAGTFEAGTYRFYINGQLVATASGQTRGPTNGAPLKIGGSGTCQPFGGLLDEVSIYNRALASNEIAAIYNAGGAGKCSLPPTVLTQPANQTVIVADVVTFIVAASGTPPLRHQWRFNGADIPTATGASLVLTNLQLRQAGNYAVIVTNAFGRAVTSNAVLTVNPPPTCVAPPSGLVSWWQAEGNANDTVGGNSAVLVYGVAFAPGRVGQAFSFPDGVTTTITTPGGQVITTTTTPDSYVEIADSPNLHFTNAMTIEAWIYPTSLGAWHNIVFKWGVQDPLQTSYTTSMNPDGRIGLGVCASGNQSLTPVVGTTSTNSVLANQWTHFAATYDGSALRMYLNGVCEDQVAYNQGIFPGTEALAIGAAGAHAGGQVLSPFAGLIDEPAVYNRALSASEIAAIYNASSAGKCPLPPTVLTQPANQTVIVGDIATYTVAAGGTPPLSYQWYQNNSAVAGATNASYTISATQPSNAGSYDVIVWNNSGSVTSAVVTLTVGILAEIDYDFETAATSPVWLGTTQMIQNTSASHQGTNAIAFTGPYPNGYLLTQLPEDTRNVEFYFYDDYGPNPPLYQYMFFRLLEDTNWPGFAGFSMLDGGWGTTPPMTENHYYAWANYDWYSGPYSASNMGPIRTIGWHQFTFAVGAQSVAMSVDGTLVFQTNMIQVARYLELQWGQGGGWGRMDDLVLTYVTVPQPTLTVSQAGNGIRVAWPVSATGFVLQETSSPPGSWANSSAAVVVQGNENVAVIATTSTLKFYRLQK